MLFGRGEFSQQDTLETLYALWGYTAGLLPMVLILVLAPAFYARKEYSVTTKAILVSVAGNLLLNGLFIGVFQWGPASIALATAISAWINVGGLAWPLKSRVESVFTAELAWDAFSFSFATGIASLSLLAWEKGRF